MTHDVACSILGMQSAVHAGCPGDCPWPLVACPATPAGAPCAAHGLCMSAWGTCQCWIGYDGADCSACADGYIRRVAPLYTLIIPYPRLWHAPNTPAHIPSRDRASTVPAYRIQGACAMAIFCDPFVVQSTSYACLISRHAMYNADVS